MPWWVWATVFVAVGGLGYLVWVFLEGCRIIGKFLWWLT